MSSDQTHVYLFPTVNIQNVLYLDELYAWADNHKLEVLLNFLDPAESLSIDNMTPTAQELVYSKLQNSSRPELCNIANRVRQSTGSDGEQFREYMQKLDNWRKQNFGLSHNEIANAMGYVLN